MIEVFRYTIAGGMNDITIVAPRMATRGFIDGADGEVIKGSGRLVDETLLGDGGRVLQGFTGEQICYLRELISLGPIATAGDTRQRGWIRQLAENRLIRVTREGGGTECAITPLGRAAAAQLF